MATAAVAAIPLTAYARPASAYAANSRLASGNWVKISVTSTGMQYIPAATLRQMGFSDASKVRVFGYGGRMISETLGEITTDDLPEQPVASVDGGIVFFATDYFDIRPTGQDEMPFKHVMHPYSEASYYFLTDSIEENAISTLSPTRPEAGSHALTSVPALAFHEVDLTPPANTGRTYLGEDFRTQPKQTYALDLPGNIAKEVKVKIGVGAAITNGTGVLTISVNGSELSDNNDDKVTALTSDGQFMSYKEVTRTASCSGQTANVAISFDSNGVCSLARLDYIEVLYERSLQLTDNQLYFYNIESGATSYAISGCSSSTIIWDLSDPGAPAPVNFSLEGSTARFTSSGSGMRQYVAFNPTAFAARPATAGTVANQDIHGMETPEYVIIYPTEFRTQAEAVADLHRNLEGMKVAVLDAQTVYNEFSSGNPDVSAFRKMFKMWYDRAQENPDLSYPRYCLMFGRPTYDNKLKTQTVTNAGYPRLPIWQSPTGYTQNSSYSTDDFIGMLSDTDSSMGLAKIHVAVGRMPAKSTAEADILVNKLIGYVNNPDYGDWRNTVMLIADDQDNGIHLSQAEEVYRLMRTGGNGSDMLYERIYLDSYPLSYGATGAGYPDARNAMYGRWRDGVMMIYYIGHASTNSWSHEGLMTWTDITTMSNTRLPFLYAATCEFGRHDDDTASGLEELMINPAGGIVTSITPSRTVYIAQNGTLSRAVAPKIFERGADGKAKRIGDIMIDGKNSYGSSDENKLRYALFGDPALRLASAEKHIKVTAIGETDMTAAEIDMPILGARAQVDISGYVEDADGNPDTSFNGYVQMSIYDAERVIETLGNGDDGKVMTYNDRKTRLFTGRARVNEGQWNLRVFMPEEIENNFSPALISLYAYDESTGIEANGANESFYVYGYDENAPEDNEGPEISEFYINNENFYNGIVTHSAPLVFARFSDPSGINVSDAGIGHKMSLVLDGNSEYDDLARFYMPDADASNSGTIVYPLSGLSAGYHKLSLRIWDTAGNSSTAVIDFNVGAISKPSIFDITCTGGTGGVPAVFTLTTDRPLTRMNCEVEVYDLCGKPIWKGTEESTVTQDSRISLTWDLHDSAGRRVPRGIYVYRAGVYDSEGNASYVSRKMAVSAESAE